MEHSERPRAVHHIEKTAADPLTPSSATAEFEDNRPEAIAQQKLAEAIQGGPPGIAQRQQSGNMIGATAQLKPRASWSSSQKAKVDELRAAYDSHFNRYTRYVLLLDTKNQTYLSMSPHYLAGNPATDPGLAATRAHYQAQYKLVQNEMIAIGRECAMMREVVGAARTAHNKYIADQNLGAEHNIAAAAAPRTVFGAVVLVPRIPAPAAAPAAAAAAGAGAAPAAAAPAVPVAAVPAAPAAAIPAVPAAGPAAGGAAAAGDMVLQDA